MKREKYTRERVIKDARDLRCIEQAVNELLKGMFFEMKLKNMCAETDTLQIRIQEGEVKRFGFFVQEEKLTGTARIECRLREADTMGYVPEAIYKNGRYTAVKWANGEVTTVKLAWGEKDSDYSAFAAAVAIKALGNNSQVKKIIQKKTVNQKAGKIVK